MRVSRNSLLVRMVFYNDIAIVISSITIALFLTFTAFQNLESKVVDSVRDKISLMNRAYNGEILKVKDDIKVNTNDIIKYWVRKENRTPISDDWELSNIKLISNGKVFFRKILIKYFQGMKFII